jgi:hypothetical protein
VTSSKIILSLLYELFNVPINVHIVLFILIKKKKKIIFNHVIDVRLTYNNVSRIRYT